MAHKNLPPPPRKFKPPQTPADRLRQAASRLSQALVRNLRNVRKGRH